MMISLGVHVQQDGMVEGHACGGVYGEVVHGRLVLLMLLMIVLLQRLFLKRSKIRRRCRYGRGRKGCRNMYAVVHGQATLHIVRDSLVSI